MIRLLAFTTKKLCTSRNFERDERSAIPGGEWVEGWLPSPCHAVCNGGRVWMKEEGSEQSFAQTRGTAVAAVRVSKAPNSSYICMYAARRKHWGGEGELREEAIV